MTSWQEEHERNGSGRTALDRASGQPTSRRAAREAERRAAEAIAEHQAHPSGVVDFEGHDFSSDFAPDQDFNVGDTQDIWAALTRGSGRPPAGAGEAPSAFGRGAEPTSPDGSAVSGELLDRVRDAVLRRGQEAPAPVEPQGATAPRTGPVPPVAQPAEPGPTRRERRLREAAEARDDELPTDLFGGRGGAPAPRPQTSEPQGYEPQAYEPRGRDAQPYQPQAYEAQGYEAQPYQPQAFEPQAFEPAAFPQTAAPAYDEYDDEGYDEPYAPEPTIAIPSLRPMELEQPSDATNPVALPSGYAEPVGNDALTFSSPLPAVQPEPLDEDDDGPADAPFGDPRAHRQTGPVQPVAPRPASSPFLEPQGFQNPQLGPPSEVTDLAGFEALIRKARQQPAPQAPARPAPAWADDEDVQEGFTGLLSRSVQGSHGSSNALILPNDPQPVDVTQAVSGTGDIFVTGSLNLPRSLSTTGTTAGHEAHDVDRFFDGSQDEPTTGVAPVRASRAISGTGESGIIRSRRTRASVLPTVLAVVAGVMAAGVLVLLVTSWVSHLF